MNNGNIQRELARLRAELDELKAEVDLLKSRSTYNTIFKNVHLKIMDSPLLSIFAMGSVVVAIGAMIYYCIIK